jgi:thiol:disulfide interchange protein DsbG
MWDATGKNLTREQVSKIDGAIPTVIVDKDGAKSVEAAARSDALLSVEKAAFGLAGDPAAPRLWMIIDPYCSYSVRAFDALRPYVTAASSLRSYRSRSSTTRTTGRARLRRNLC